MSCPSVTLGMAGSAVRLSLSDTRLQCLRPVMAISWRLQPDFNVNDMSESMGSGPRNSSGIYTYAAFLRDTETYGFALPPEWIRPVGEETGVMVDYLARFIAKQRGLAF
ncbi:hypothetical protein B0H13DRAFT_1865081 [Mycena leptocephala]|nr:hypothetical protein B0H13DRAFT_1865081 [Mycena leptocephala]